MFESSIQCCIVFLFILWGVQDCVLVVLVVQLCDLLKFFTRLQRKLDVTLHEE